AEKRLSRETALRAKRGAPFAATRDRVMKLVESVRSIRGFRIIRAAFPPRRRCKDPMIQRFKDQ
ncbi:MAG: hypothetical protein M3P13_09050, partial [Acidobacteriota bacterium]|nr:hypothetical protein [Acidobacteriota bacterium]